MDVMYVSTCLFFVGFSFHQFSFNVEKSHECKPVLRSCLNLLAQKFFLFFLFSTEVCDSYRDSGSYGSHALCLKDDFSLFRKGAYCLVTKTCPTF